ncbi:Catabolite control protein, partial [Dysosmobacter welbionis]
GKLVLCTAGVDAQHKGIRRGEGSGDVQQQALPVLAHHLQNRGIAVVGVAAPGDLDPAPLLPRLGSLLLRGVGTVAPVDGHAVPPGDKADDVVPRHRGAALGELHQAVIQALHDDALLALHPLGSGGLFGRLRRFGLRQLLGGLFRLVELRHPVQLPLDPAHCLLGGEAAVADGGVHVVQRAVGHPLQQHRQHLRRENVLHGDAAVLQLRLEGGTAVCDVLLFLLLLEPLANLAAGLAASGNLHPVPAGTLGVLGGEDLHDVAVFQHMVQRDDPAVHLGAHHPVAHGGVDGVGKVDGRGAGGQVLHVAARCEDEHLIGEHIDLQRVDIVLCVRALLVFQQTADPLVAPFGAGALAVLLVFPV